MLAHKDSLRILVVDDDPDTVDAMVMLLRVLGYEALAAYDGATALKIAETLLPEVVLLDAAMPGYDGFRLASALRQTPAMKDALLICISGYGTNHYRQLALEAGCDFHLVKPIDDWAEFVHMIETAKRRTVLALST